MLQPNLFIVGAPKAGTTYLFEKLKNHPDIYFPKIKELNYFSANHLENNSYYDDYKVKDEGKYLTFYKNAKDEKYLIDGSVSYFAFPDIAAKIFLFNPKAKIIVTLRDPIKRAFSHYLMDKRMGHASLPFGEYLNEAHHPKHYAQYIGNSMYYRNLKEYVDVFGRENVLIIKNDDLDKGLLHVCNFLGLVFDSKYENELKVVNENKAPRNFISKYFQRHRNIVSKFKLIIPPLFIKKLNRFLYKSALLEEMTATEREICYNFLKEDQENLKKYLDYGQTN